MIGVSFASFGQRIDFLLGTMQAALRTDTAISYSILTLVLDIVELQLHLEEFLKLKNSRGHVDYEAARSIHMFNEAFSHCSFRWLPETDKDQVDAVLRDISEGVTTSINMDYSEGLWSPEAQSKLAKAFLDERCRIRALSLRSCRCGDDFYCKVFTIG